MTGVVGIVAFLTVLVLSLLITRIATLALILTGLSHEAARFQARSAFTGTGFTTSEAESVVNHPVRRRIIMFLMILRSAGLVTIIISLILSLTGTESGIQQLQRLLWIIGGVMVLWILAWTPVVNRFLNSAVSWALRKWTNVNTCDYENLLNLAGDYGVTKINVDEGDWLVNAELRELDLQDEGVLVLGITRNDGSYVGAPRGGTKIYSGDLLVLYGRVPALQKLDQRRYGSSGEKEHADAVDEQKRHLAAQEEQETRYSQTREKENRSRAERPD